MLRVKQSTSYMGTYGELGRYPLFITRYCRIIKYCCKIIDMDNLIIKRLYHNMLKDCVKFTLQNKEYLSI